MPITEDTPQVPINPPEVIILDFSKNNSMAVMILRYFNVIGLDPKGQLGEAPRPELCEHGRISGACFDAALGIIPGLKVKGTDYNTEDGTCISDYITDLVHAHVKAPDKARQKKAGIYNVGTRKGRSVREFVEACKKATGMDIKDIKVDYLSYRPGDYAEVYKATGMDIKDIKVDYLSCRPGDYAEVYSNPSKINRGLNWSTQYTDLEKSLRVAWRWQKSHLNGYGSHLAMDS